jgi:hypothetical protein
MPKGYGVEINFTDTQLFSTGLPVVSKNSIKKYQSLTDKKDIRKNPDHKIDEDFPGFPNGSATEKIITPKTALEKKVAAVNITDEEKVNKNKDEKYEAESDGSGGAFSATEQVKDDE